MPAKKPPEDAPPPTVEQAMAATDGDLPTRSERTDLQGAPSEDPNAYPLPDRSLQLKGPGEVDINDAPGTIKATAIPNTPERPSPIASPFDLVNQRWEAEEARRRARFSVQATHGPELYEAARAVMNVYQGRGGGGSSLPKALTNAIENLMDAVVACEREYPAEYR